jgi:hypothetical protein
MFNKGYNEGYNVGFKEYVKRDLELKGLSHTYDTIINKKFGSAGRHSTLKAKKQIKIAENKKRTKIIKTPIELRINLLSSLRIKKNKFEKSFFKEFGNFKRVNRFFQRNKKNVK